MEVESVTVNGVFRAISSLIDTMDGVGQWHGCAHGLGILHEFERIYFRFVVFIFGFIYLGIHLTKYYCQLVKLWARFWRC